VSQLLFPRPNLPTRSISSSLRPDLYIDFHEETFYVPTLCLCFPILDFLFFRLQWFVRNEVDGGTDRDVVEVKFEADFAFASNNYERARDLYAEILTRSKGMGSIRDVLEGLARCCLQTNRLEEALRWAIKLVMPSFAIFVQSRDQTFL
jgi:hypothetical protein